LIPGSLIQNPFCQRLQGASLSARDIAFLSHNPEFQSIPNRNSQTIFLREFERHKCFADINDKDFIITCQMTQGNVRQLLSQARKHAESPDVRRGRQLALADQRETELT
jgi:hypothetical protein